jgi:transcriptional regulator GlxA family with amidase domain
MIGDDFACRDRRVARVLKRVQRDLTIRMTLTSAAEFAGLQQCYFSRRFRRVMGITFHKWNAQIRVAEAKRLLKILDLSITAVAASVGYPDMTTFERVFRRIEGVNPREYRCLSAARGSNKQESPKQGQESPKPWQETPRPKLSA